MTCRVGEEDKLAREGSEERRIMGLRREILIFILLVGTLLNGYQHGWGVEGGRRRDRKRHNRQIAALHAPHIEEEFSHTWTHKETLTHTPTHMSERKNKVFVQCGRETQHPVMVCLCKKKQKNV